MKNQRWATGLTLAKFRVENGIQRGYNLARNTVLCLHNVVWPEGLNSDNLALRNGMINLKSQK